jgi:putative hemolysin
MAPGLADVFIPVPWRESERNAASRRSLVAELGRTLRGEGILVFFPSGRLAYCTSDGLTERPWQPTVITVARKFRAPILPLHIRARNSPLFYGLSRLSDELRDITLFHELLNKGATRFHITLGRAIDPRSLPDDPVAAAGRLQRYVEHELPRATAREPQLTPPRHATR